MKEKDTKREEAQERKLKRSKRTAQEQLDLLDQKFGVGQGAMKERVRLIKLVSKKN